MTEDLVLMTEILSFRINTEAEEVENERFDTNKPKSLYLALSF